VVHEGQAGGGLCGSARDRGALGALEPPSAYIDDLGRDDPAAEVAGGGRLSLHRTAQKMAVSPLHHAEAAGGHARVQSQDQRFVAQVSPRPGCLLGRGQGPGGGRGVGILLGEVRRQAPDLPAAHPELRRAASAVLVQRSQDQATAGGRGLGADVHRPDGTTYSAERVPSYSLLWAACDVQSQEGEGVTHRVDGGAGSADQGDVSYRGAEDLPGSRAGQYGPCPLPLSSGWGGGRGVGGG